jgi:DNA-binding transcriptional ArsR family regulator
MAKVRPVHEVLKALAEPRRIAILKLVHEEEMAAGEIAKHFRTTRQAISQHLRLLTRAGLLVERREGTRRYYSVRRGAFGELRSFLNLFWDEALFASKGAAGKPGRRNRR